MLAIWLKTDRKNLVVALNPLQDVVSVYWNTDGKCRSDKCLQVARLSAQRMNIPGSAKAIAEAMLDDLGYTP